MKNLMRSFIYGRNTKTSAYLVVGILAFVGLGCFASGRSKSSAPFPPAYVGDWKGQDGSTLWIRGDGKGNYKAENTSVDGGMVEVDETKKN